MKLQNIDRQVKTRILDIKPMNVVKLLLRGKGRAVIHYYKTQNMENILSKLLTQIIINQNFEREKTSYVLSSVKILYL